MPMKTFDANQSFLISFIITLTAHALLLFAFLNKPLTAPAQLYSPSLSIHFNSPTNKASLPTPPASTPPLITPQPTSPASSFLQAAVPLSPAASLPTPPNTNTPEASHSPSASSPPLPSSTSITFPHVDAHFMQNNPKPDYPRLSQTLGEKGRVLLEVYILSNGDVGDIRIKSSSGFARLDQAALKAVRQWRYIPAIKGNKPIDFWYVQPIDFVLTP